MKRKISIFIYALIAVSILLTACGAPQAKDNASAGVAPSASPSPSASSSASAVSAEDNPSLGTIDGQPVYFNDFIKWYYMACAAEIETSEDPNQILDDYMSYKVENMEFQAKGYTSLTSDEASEAEQNAEDCLSQNEQDYDETEDQVLSGMGITKDELIDYFKFQTEEANAEQAMAGSQTPTDDQIKTEYDSDVSSDQSQVESDPTFYTSQVNSGAPVYYVPSGVRMIKRILIPLDSDYAGAVSALRDQYSDQADILLTLGLAKIKDQAQQMANAVSSEGFDKALAQYGKDDSMPDGGYAVISSSADMGADFTTKAMALSKPGDVSGLFYTDAGYQVIQYTSDKAEGAVSLDDAKNDIIAALQPDMQDTAWTSLVTQWKTDHNVKPDYNVLPNME